MTRKTLLAVSILALIVTAGLFSYLQASGQEDQSQSATQASLASLNDVGIKVINVPDGVVVKMTSANAEVVKALQARFDEYKKAATKDARLAILGFGASGAEPVLEVNGELHEEGSEECEKAHKEGHKKSDWKALKGEGKAGECSTHKEGSIEGEKAHKEGACKGDKTGELKEGSEECTKALKEGHKHDAHEKGETQEHHQEGEQSAPE